MTTRVFLNTDIGCEVDDQFALAYAARHPELELMGVGATFFTDAGAVREGSAKTAWDEATKVLRYLGRPDVPVHHGLRGPISSSTGHDDAAHAIIELAHASDDLLHVVSIGAQSNLARAVHLDPSIVPRIRAVFLDGSYPFASTISYNMTNDLEAVRVVLESGCDYLQVPAPDVTNQLQVTTDRLRRFFPVGDRAGRYLMTLAEQMQLDIEEMGIAMDATDDPAAERRRMSELLGWDVDKAGLLLWDVGAIVAVARPDLTTVVEDGAPLYELDPESTWNYRVTSRPDNPRRIGVVTGLDVAAIWDDYRDVMHGS